MKLSLLRTLVVLLLIALPWAANAQQSSGVLVQQNATRLDACNVTTTATGAANTAVTATITVPAGQHFYVCYIHIAQAANAAVTGAAGPAPIFTTTNLQTNLVWWGNNATQGTGLYTLVTDSTFGFPLKTLTPGTAFTIVTSAGQSTNSVRINVAGYFAP
jgi:hypothetical protein